MYGVLLRIIVKLILCCCSVSVAAGAYACCCVLNQPAAHCMIVTLHCHTCRTGNRPACRLVVLILNRLRPAPARTYNRTLAELLLLLYCCCPTQDACSGGDLTAPQASQLYRAAISSLEGET
jgi:hypothetical protein